MISFLFQSFTTLDFLFHEIPLLLTLIEFNYALLSLMQKSYLNLIFTPLLLDIFIGDRGLGELAYVLG